MTTLHMADTAADLTPHAAAVLAAQGIDAVALYLGSGYHHLTRAQIDAAHSAGLGVLLLWEGAATTPADFTRARAQRAAHVAAQARHVLGAPADSVVVAAVDFEAAQGDLTAIGDYAEAWGEVLGDSAGIYGGAQVIEYLRQRFPTLWTYQTYAWSGGRKVPGIDAYQYQNNVDLGGVMVDLDELYTERGLWWPQGKGGVRVSTQYAHIKVYIGPRAKAWDAIVVDNVAHVLWTAAAALGSSVRNDGHGVLTIAGKRVQCTVSGGQDYVPWADLAAHVEARKIGSAWHFTAAEPTPEPKPEPKPAPAPTLPETVSLWEWMGPIHNQLSQGACTGEATVALREWYEHKATPDAPFVTGSAEAAYAWSRIESGDLNQDAGANLGVTVGTLVKYGMAPKYTDPLNGADEYAAPTPEAVAAAAPYKVKAIRAVGFTNTPAQTSDILARALAEGAPVALAAVFNTSFYAPQPGGVVDVTKGATQQDEGHAFLCLGYADANYFGVTGYTGRLFACQNSWGVAYGITLPGQEQGGCMLLTEQTVNDLVYCGYTIEL